MAYYSIHEQILHKSSSSYWVYDLDNRMLVWANQAALVLWDTHSFEEASLYNKEILNDDKNIEDFLDCHQKSFEGQQVKDVWNYSPNKQMVSVECIYSCIDLLENKKGLLVQGTPLPVNHPLESIHFLADKIFNCLPGKMVVYNTRMEKIFENIIVSVEENYFPYEESLLLDSHVLFHLDHYGYYKKTHNNGIIEIFKIHHNEDFYVSFLFDFHNPKQELTQENLKRKAAELNTKYLEFMDKTLLPYLSRAEEGVSKIINLDRLEEYQYLIHEVKNQIDFAQKDINNFSKKISLLNKNNTEQQNILNLHDFIIQIQKYYQKETSKKDVQLNFNCYIDSNPFIRINDVKLKNIFFIFFDVFLNFIESINCKISIHFNDYNDYQNKLCLKIILEDEYTSIHTHDSFVASLLEFYKVIKLSYPTFIELIDYFEGEVGIDIHHNEKNGAYFYILIKKDNHKKEVSSKKIKSLTPMEEFVHQDTFYELKKHTDKKALVSLIQKFLDYTKRMVECFSQDDQISPDVIIKSLNNFFEMASSLGTRPLYNAAQKIENILKQGIKVTEADKQIFIYLLEKTEKSLFLLLAQ